MDIKEVANVDLDFINSYRVIEAKVHTNALEKGFWQGERDVMNRVGDSNEVGDLIKIIKPALMNQRLTLIITELIEAFEDMRKGKTASDHIPDYTPLEEEMADAVIRIMDTAAGYRLDVAGAIIEKIKYNASREYLHGKKF